MLENHEHWQDGIVGDDKEKQCELCGGKSVVRTLRLDGDVVNFPWIELCCWCAPKYIEMFGE